MLIGGSPGSTAGGMKTTTLAVLLASAFAVFRRRADPHFFHRRIASETVSQAATIMMMYLVLFCAADWPSAGSEGLPVLNPACLKRHPPSGQWACPWASHRTWAASPI